MNLELVTREARRLSLRCGQAASIYAMYLRHGADKPATLEFFTLRFLTCERADLDGLEGHRLMTFERGVEVLRPRLPQGGMQETEGEVMEGVPD